MDGQKAHEKCWTSVIMRNASQNYNEMSSHTGQNAHHQKNLQTINAGEGTEKKEPSYTVGGNINWCSPYGKDNGDFSKN